MKQWLWIAFFAIGYVSEASAGVYEISLGFWYNRSNYSNSNYNWNRRLGAAFAYHFSETSGLEFSYQDVVERTHLEGFQDTRFHDRILAVNWVQSIFGRNDPIQPYFKVGVGQLYREASGSYVGGMAPPAEVDSATAIAAIGLRLFFTRTIALRSEVTSYLTGARLGTWQDNIAASIGLSVYF